MNSGPLRIADKMADPAFVASIPASRDAALAQGSSIYMGGACPKNHTSYRKTVNGACAQCASEQSNASKQRYAASPARTAVNKTWNSSDKAKSAKQRWKDRDPKWAWVVSTVGGARRRAKYAGLPFALTNQYVYDMLPDVCPALGVPLVFAGTGGVALPGSASIDKIRPELGYVPGNIAILSYRANVIKSDASAAEILRVAEWLAKAAK